MIQHFVVNLTDTTASRGTVSVANDILWGEFKRVGPSLCKPTACRITQRVLPKWNGVLVPENKARDTTLCI
jgi:hypothetical protein